MLKTWFFCVFVTPGGWWGGVVRRGGGTFKVLNTNNCYNTQNIRWGGGVSGGGGDIQSLKYKQLLQYLKDQSIKSAQHRV